ncbi:MAG: hypothetical protein ABSG98_04240 [Anaerolineales bacterium]
MDAWLIGIRNALFHSGFLGTSPRTWLAMGNLLIVSLLIWGVWCLWILARHDDALYAGLAAVLFAAAQVVGLELLLGLLGVLYLSVLEPVEVLVSLVFFLVAIRPRLPEARENARLFWDRRRGLRPSLLVVVLLALGSFVLLRSLFEGFFLPPREWDALTYHLPIMAAFYQMHAIRPLHSLVVWVDSYPFDGELLSLWTVVFLGLDKLVDLSYLPILLAGLVSLYGLARTLGLSRRGSLVGASLAAFAPAVIAQQVTAHLDAFTMALLALGLYLGVSGSQEKSSYRGLSTSALSVGLASGLLIGSKYTGLVYAAVIILVALAWRAKSNLAALALAGRRLWARFVLTTLAVLGLILLLGAYPYIRNLVEFQNPLAPYRFQIGDVVLFPGSRLPSQIVTDNTSQSLLAQPLVLRLLRLWLDPGLAAHQDTSFGLGAIWLGVGLPACVLWLVYLTYRRKFLLLFTALAILACVVATPAFWVPRYSLPLLIVGGLAAAWIYDLLGSRLGIGLGIGVSALAAFAVFVSSDLGGISPPVLRDYVASRDDATRSSAPFAGEGRNTFLYLDQKTENNPQVIAYTGLVRFVYPLYGPDFHNKVLPFPGGPEQSWEASLEKESVNYVLAVRGKPQYTWIVSDPSYEEVASDGSYGLFERKQ